MRNLLSGADLGHPLHPMLTDLPIGAWVMSALPDAGRPAAEGAADLLVTAGVMAAGPTAAAGLHDWSDTAGPQTRVGLVHAALSAWVLVPSMTVWGGPSVLSAAIFCWASLIAAFIERCWSWRDGVEAARVAGRLALTRSLGQGPADRSRGRRIRAGWA